MHHYFCMHYFIPQKLSEINADKLLLIPHAIKILSTTVEDFIRQATSDIINILTYPPKSTAYVLQLGGTTRSILLQVDNILNFNQVTSDVLKH